MTSTWLDIPTLWNAIAITLAAAGVAALWFGVRGDRSRGRRRCPKCWYDCSSLRLSGSSDSAAARCPECGRAIASERALLRPRRRWRLVAASPVLFIAAWAAVCVPRVRVEGRVGWVPTPGLFVWLLVVRDQSDMSPPERRYPVGPFVPGEWPPSLEASRTTFTRRFLERTRKERASEIVRRGYRWLTCAVIQRDLAAYPPRNDAPLNSLFEQLDSRLDDAGTFEATLVAPYFELGSDPAPGDPLYAMLHTIGPITMPFAVRVQTSWGADVRIECVQAPSESPFLRKLMQGDGYPNPVLSLGVPPPGATEVEITSSIHPLAVARIGESKDLPTRAMWERPARVTYSTRIPIRTRPREADPRVPIAIPAGYNTVTTVNSLSYASRFVTLSRREFSKVLELCFAFPIDEHPGWGELSLIKGITLGAEIDVLNDRGDVLFTGEVCLSSTQPAAEYPWGFFLGTPDCRRVRLTAARELRPKEEQTATRVRLKCGRRLALQNPNCKEYIEGEIELPLYNTISIDAK